MAVLSQRKLDHVLRLLWITALVLVIVGTLLPGNSAPMRALAHLEINDKVQHFASYAVLAFLPALHERRRLVAVLAGALILLGILLEFGQRLSPGRDFELGDMLADAAGVAVGALAGWCVWLRVKHARPFTSWR